MQTFAPRQSPIQGRVSSNVARADHAVRMPVHEPDPRLPGPKPNRPKYDFSLIPIHPPSRVAMQMKRAIDTQGGQYEQDADHIADWVMRMPNPRTVAKSVAAGSDGCSCGGGCDKCSAEQGQDARLMMKRAGSGSLEHTEVPPTVHEVLRSPGQSLDQATRIYMEARFGHDFRGVRLYSGPAAEQSAEDVNAHAYTVGQKIVFNKGRFAPGTAQGQRLLAHELAHVVQQTGGEPLYRQPGDAEGGVSQRIALQREPKKEEKQVSQDIAILLDPKPDFVTLASVLAPGAHVLHATSVDDLVKQLKAINGPIRTLYFVGHMNEDGDLLFTSPGKMDYVRAETVATKIKGSATVEGIDFRGCNLGQSPAEMDKIRVALNATEATGSTCTLVSQIAGPIKVDGRPITRPEDLNDKKVKTAFDAEFKKARELFEDKKKTCIVNDSTEGYFQAGARLVAYWANPGSMADEDGWDDSKSTCYKNLKVEKIDQTKKPPVIGPDDCKLVTNIGKK